MDNIAHSMLGVAMARAGLAGRFGRGTTVTLLVASNLPDVDALVNRALGVEMGFLIRRTWTHSVLVIPVLALLGALALRLLYREMQFRILYGLMLLGILGHVFFDLLNSYGVCAIYPIADTRFELAWVFIIDLGFWATLIVPVVLSLLPPLRRWKEHCGQAALILLGAYIATCGVGRLWAVAVLDGIAADEGMQAELAHVFPEPFGPQRWRGVLQEGDELRAYLIHLPSGRWEEGARHRTDREHPYVRAMRASEGARRLEWFYKAPVWRLLETPVPADGEPPGPDAVIAEAEVFDMRFQSLVLGWRRAPFAHRFRLRADGAVVGPERESPADPEPTGD